MFIVTASEKITLTVNWAG